MASPLPPSSPPPPSPPQSSPQRFNLVSSPGPMGPLPKEEEYDDLPYTLPPGPYSPQKPDLSYAALVGRAILSSPEHRLTLQEIYDWITIVYPHYKRGETTWMNSIRHVLSTTVCFRKVPRDRAVGRTLWAIWDEDLPCFKDGGFKKHLCKEYANSSEGKERAIGGSKAKPRVRKRVDDDDIVDGRKAKRVKKDQAGNSSSEPSSISGPLSSHLLFPPTRPTPHHQPYYESCIPQPQILPAEIIFPPLPPTAAFNRVVNSNTSSSACETAIPKTCAKPSPVLQFLSSSSSSSSIPDLTPNRNSSSPPSSLPATSDMEVDSRPLSAKDDDCMLGVSGTSSKDGPEADTIFGTALLGPVRFWGDSPKTSAVLQPGIELFNFDNISEEGDKASRQDKKGKKLVSRSTKVS
jgi:forkhead-containing protein